MVETQQQSVPTGSNMGAYQGLDLGSGAQVHRFSFQTYQRSVRTTCQVTPTESPLLLSFYSLCSCLCHRPSATTVITQTTQPQRWRQTHHVRITIFTADDSSSQLCLVITLLFLCSLWDSSALSSKHRELRQSPSSSGLLYWWTAGTADFLSTVIQMHVKYGFSINVKKFC